MRKVLFDCNLQRSVKLHLQEKCLREAKDFLAFNVLSPSMVRLFRIRFGKWREILSQLKNCQSVMAPKTFLGGGILKLTNNFEKKSLCAMFCPKNTNELAGRFEKALLMVHSCKTHQDSFVGLKNELDAFCKVSQP
ncbi:hypothetical protein GOODEAATRI_000040 [Goodea atripinnis]|uniref:Uncharacterized protein n=1 Tax=Goodea atripinnis TaxID=208336 RepID=A0ABV0N6L7_9TELE